MRAVIEKYASRVSENSIAKETSAGSHNTVASYLDLSEKLFLTRIVYRVEWGTGYKPLFRSNKKVYFTDPLLYRVMKLYALGDGRLADEELAKLLEGVIGEHVMRRYRAGYAIAKSGKEVDFALGDVAVEVKGRSASLRDLNWEKGYVLSHDEFDVTENKAMVPASIFLYLISEDRLFYDF
ncbi:MAG: DUF4143 domain-containing protein, partial [Thermoprotei archaeon]